MATGHPLEQPRWLASWPSHADSEHAKKAGQSAGRNKSQSTSYTGTEAEGQTAKTS